MCVDCSKAGDTFRLRHGDVVELMDELQAQALKADWMYGRCERTGLCGGFPYDSIYILPTCEKPPPEFMVKAKFHLASLLANKLANTSWPTSCPTSSHVVQQVGQLFVGQLVSQHARSISTCRDWNNKLANFFVGSPICQDIWILFSLFINVSEVQTYLKYA